MKTANLVAGCGKQNLIHTSILQGFEALKWKKKTKKNGFQRNDFCGFLCEIWQKEKKKKKKSFFVVLVNITAELYLSKCGGKICLCLVSSVKQNSKFELNERN